MRCMCCRAFVKCPLGAAGNNDIVHGDIRMNSRRMGSHLVWNSVRVIAAQSPEMVLGAEADPAYR